MAIELTKEVQERLIVSIKRYFDEELEYEIGDLKARMLLDFCLEEIGPSVYNRAVADAQTQLAGQVADLDGSCFEPEFAYRDKRRGC